MPLLCAKHTQQTKNMEGNSFKRIQISLLVLNVNYEKNISSY